MPLLGGALGAKGRAALREVSERFLRLTPAGTPSIGLGVGLGGVALAHDALARVFPGKGHIRCAENALNKLVRDLAGARKATPGLYSGIAGVGWVTTRLLGEPSGGGDPCAGFDAALIEYLSQPDWWGPFDLIEGLAGVAVYALARVRLPSGARLVSLAVDRLFETCRRRGVGIAWWSDPAWTPPDARTAPGEWNLGVAHGVAGVIAVLARIVGEARVDRRTRDRASALLQRAVEWLLAQELPRSSYGSFPRSEGRNASTEPARLAWCVGDPGIACALLLAGRHARDSAWRRAGLRVARRAASRPVARAGVMDPGLCHGASGLGHVFHRLFIETGDASFADAARFWFGYALNMRVRDAGFAGFQSERVDALGRYRWRPDAGLVMGAAGFVLALVAAVTDEDPGWDSMMALS